MDSIDPCVRERDEWKARAEKAEERASFLEVHVVDSVNAAIAKERAAVARWIRDLASVSSRWIAESIERGEHLKGGWVMRLRRPTDEMSLDDVQVDKTPNLRGDPVWHVRVCVNVVATYTTRREAERLAARIRRALKGDR